MKERIKKLCSIIVCFALMIALTGCVKYELKMGVKDDKSVDLELIYALDSSYMNSLNTDDDDDTNVTTTDDDEDDDSSEDFKKENYDFLAKKGYTVEEYKNNDDDHKYEGVKIKKTFKSIDDITKESEKTIDINKLFQDKDFDDSQFFSKKGNVYKASFIFDMEEEGSTSSDMGSTYDSMFDMTYTVTLPSKAVENNATKVSEDGKTLTWELKYGKKNEIKYSFELGDVKESKEDKKSESKDDDKLTLYIIIGCSAGAVVLVLVILIIVLSKKKNQPQV